MMRADAKSAGFTSLITSEPSHHPRSPLARSGVKSAFRMAVPDAPPEAAAAGPLSSPVSSVSQRSGSPCPLLSGRQCHDRLGRPSGRGIPADSPAEETLGRMARERAPVASRPGVRPDTHRDAVKTGHSAARPAKAALCIGVATTAKAAVPPAMRPAPWCLLLQGTAADRRTDS